jgi:hypothetical protein
MGAAASATSAGLTLATSVMAGEGQKAADDYQSAELSEKAKLGQAAATETNSDMVARLNSSLANIDAVRAAAGDSMSSPTGAALRSTDAANANQERSIRVGNILSQSETDQAGANYMQSAGSFALTQGWLSGAAGAAGQIAQTNSGTFGMPGGGGS